jgi:hypothetical protein
VRLACGTKINEKAVMRIASGPNNVAAPRRLAAAAVPTITVAMDVIRTAPSESRE